jgi:hypothetical protein
MKRIRCVTLLVAALGVAALGGCGFHSERHSTTESRYMTPTEQAYWSDRQSRQDKARYWSEELERQSAVRMERSMDPSNW